MDFAYRRCGIIIYGKQAVLEALRSPQVVIKVTLGQELEQKNLIPVLRLCENKNVPVEYMPKAKLQILCGAVIHQGFVARLADYKYLGAADLFKLLKSQPEALVLILDQIQDMHNLGAIIRTAEGVNVSAVVLTATGSAGINATVAKTSSGALFHCRIHCTENLLRLLPDLRSAGLKIIGTVLSGGKNLYQNDFSGRVAVIVGSEGKGIRKSILQHCDELVSIPMRGRIDSLNASVSTAVLLYEILRQRSFGTKSDEHPGAG